MKRTTRAVAVLLLWAVPSGALAYQRPATIQPEVIREYVSYLASAPLAGRGTGTRGNEAAARYIGTAFRHARLKPLGTWRQNAAGAALDRSGYFQPFTFPAGVAPGRSNRLQAVVGGKPARYRAGVEFEPASASGSAKVSGQVVFVGYGIDSRDPARNDYGDVDVKGKVVLMLAGTPGADPRSLLAAFGDVRRRAAFARDRGAAAVLVALAQASDKPRMGQDGYGRDAGLPVVMLRRSVAEAWLQADGKSLAEVEKALAGSPQPFATSVTLTLWTDVRKVTRTTANVAGLLEGSDPVLRDEVVVVGAHMDHLGMGGPGSMATDRTPTIHPGADDNASGTAAVMALAGYFHASSTRPKRSILFICFSGEELGLLGSWHYVKNPLLPIERTVAMVNMDMVGRMQNNQLIVVGGGTSPNWPALLAEANRPLGLTLATNDGEFGASDHFPFYQQQVPVLFFFTGLHPDYHRPSDTADKINAIGEARVAELAAACVERIGDAPSRPAYRQIAVQTGGQPTRYRVSLGTIPDMTADVEGVRISGVGPGTPAEKAGLKAGDVIVKLGDRSVRSLQDMAAALAEHKAGDVVAVVVKRAGQTLTLTATLAPSAR